MCKNPSKANVKYTAETYCVITSGETGWCVKQGDDTVCDVYLHGELMARHIAWLLNQSYQNQSKD